MPRDERAKRLLQQEEAFIHHPSFEEPGAARTILQAPPREPADSSLNRRPASSDSYIARLYEVPLLDRELEFHLFRKLNFLKFLAQRSRRRLNPRTATERQLDDLECLLEAIRVTRNAIVEANLRLVFALAKRYATPGSPAFDEFVSEGNLALMRAADRFDFSRGVKFSTYATWAVVNGFNAHLKKKRNVERRQISDQTDGVAESLTDHRESPAHERVLSELKRGVATLLDQLNERERAIIEARFGFGQELRQPTLRELGDRLGVSKERIRQLQERALHKLRGVASRERIDLPDI